MKYTPLDLSFISSKYSPEQASVRNTAQMIMANAGWSKQSQATLKDIAAYNKKNQGPSHKQGFLGGIFDLLSTPLYGVANALDEAIAGHQSDSNDSVLEDIAKTVGGVGTGLARGLGAGLRGSTSILDALPGVDINDEWQSNPEDKTHFSDVAIRNLTGMATGDAMKPENWDKIKGILEDVNAKPWYEKTLFEAAAPNDLESPDARQDFFKNEALAGLPIDVGADPLNFILPGINLGRKGATTGKNLTEGLDAARAGESSINSILEGLKLKNVSGFTPKVGLDSESPIKAFDEASSLPSQIAPKVTPPAPVPPTPIAHFPAPVQMELPEVIGGKVRPKQSLKYTAGTSDVITREAWDYGSRLIAANHNPAGVLRSKYNLTDAAISEIDKHARAGTTPQFGTAAPIASEPIASAGEPFATVAHDASKVSTRAPGAFKDLENIGRREETVKKALDVSRHDQGDLAKQITSFAASGDKKWAYAAADALSKHPTVKWVETEKLLEMARANIQKVGPARGLGSTFVPALKRAIGTDVAAAAASRPAQIERRLGNIGEDLTPVAVEGGKIVKGSSPLKLKRPEAELANKVVRKFEGEVLGRRGAVGTGPNLARAIAEGRNVRYSGPQQARMWNHINTLLLKVPPAYRYKKAVRILRAVENYFISKGVIPHSTSAVEAKRGIPGAVPLRLSQVAEALGPDILAKSHDYITKILAGDPKALANLTPKQVEALQGLRANEAIAAAPAVAKGIDQAKGIAEAFAKAPLSVGRKNSEAAAVIRKVKEFTAAQGGGDVGAHVVGKFMGNLLGTKDIVNTVLVSNKLKTQAWLANSVKTGGAVNDPDFLKSVTNAITKAAELPSPAQLGNLAGPTAKVADWLGARFNAAYGVQDMRQIFLIQQASAMSTTARRAKLINNLGRKFDPRDVDLWHEAFRTAQMNGIADGRVAELHSEIAKAMENLFGGSGLRSGAIADSTVVGRSRLLVDELNKNLKRFGLGQYEFAAKKVKDAAGVEHDFTKGMDWMRSWEAWDVKNPYEFLHKVQNAIEHTVREKGMFDELLSRFASPVKKGSVKYGVDHPRLKGYFFTEEGARQAKVFVRILDEVSTPNSKSMQHFDHVLSKLKASLTIYIPGHHWTNLIGDTMYNWIAGVNKPVRYEQAMKTMLAQKGRYGDFASFDKLAGPKALEQAMARSLVGPDAGLALPAAGTKTIITMQNGTKVTADMIYTAAFKEGILPSARVLEEVGSDVTSVLDKIRPLGGRGQRAAHQVSEVRDHIPRLAQFIDGLAKSKSSFPSAVSSSARSVRKWHPDGLDLTKFERQVMKRVFPFYSWTRKAIPLAIESVIFNGNKVMAYPRLMEAIGLINGVDPAQGTTDPFPTDQMFPDWLRNRGIGPIAGGPGNYTVVNPSTPVLDVLTMLGEPGQAAIDNLNPMGKVPLETWQHRALGEGGAPIGPDTSSWLDYAAKQIPAVSQAGRASGQFGVSDKTKAEGFPNWTNIQNLLLGLKKVDTGKYQKSAQFDVRDYFKQKANQQFR